jgi:hypothetical protein
MSQELEPAKERAQISQAELEASKAQLSRLEDESRKWQERNSQLLSKVRLYKLDTPYAHQHQFKYDRIDPAEVQSLKDEIESLKVQKAEVERQKVEMQQTDSERQAVIDSHTAKVRSLLQYRILGYSRRRLSVDRILGREPSTIKRNNLKTKCHQQIQDTGGQRQNHIACCR